MTEYSFPFFDFLAAIQFLSTTFVLSILILLKKIEVPYLNFTIRMEILPVSLMFLGNVICGLGSTKSLNLPMFTALCSVRLSDSFGKDAYDWPIN